jgi:hypothetical protein
VSLEHSARVILRVRAAADVHADVFLDASEIVPPSRGGLFGGENVMRLMRALFGGGARVDDRAIPFGCSAFYLTAWRSVNLTCGDLARACAASGAFPAIWAPLRVPAADVGETLGLSRNRRKTHLFFSCSEVVAFKYAYSLLFEEWGPTKPWVVLEQK